MIKGWSIIHALSPSTTANSFGLTLNCYYCTAAALQGMNSIQLTVESKVPQKSTGNVADFQAVMRGRVLSRDFVDPKQVEQFLLSYLPPNQAVALGYTRNNGTGHMIVVFKVAHRVDVQPFSHGYQVNTVQPPQGHLRHVDYQLTYPEVTDGLVPLKEEQSISKYTVVWLA